MSVGSSFNDKYVTIKQQKLQRKYIDPHKSRDKTAPNLLLLFDQLTASEVQEGTANKFTTLGLYSLNKNK